jgi:methylmalonyl-CoA mutase cobalamin-binding domain/chain
MLSVELRELIPSGLPRGQDLVEAGRKRARAIPLGRSRYTEIHGAVSDREYKERCRETNTITTYLNLGYKSWAETAAALNEISAQGDRLGFRLDRVSLIPDRRMGLPPELRDKAMEETGIMMRSEADWLGAARDTPVQPIWNDHNLGSPAALVNTEAALRAGFGYVGNLAQHNYGYPLWEDDVEQMVRTVEAIGMIAEKSPDGIVLEAYIEDGFAASFHDLATSLGWCLFHRYIAEELIGAPHSQSFGSTFSDPVLKQGFGLALDAINVHRVPPSFTHGDTNSFGTADTFDRNAVIVMMDVFYTIARELRYPTGGAVHATPVSEAQRIPTVDELVQSLVIINEAERRARLSGHLIDWAPILETRDRILDGGRRVFKKLIDGLSELGVDVRDPLQLLLATRRLGGSKIEELFGVGEPDSSFPRGFRPIVSSDTLRRLMERFQQEMSSLTSEEAAPDLRGLRIIAASGDIHEYGLFVVSQVLNRLGAKVINLGTSVTSQTIAKVAVETDADAVALSTYNGMALSLGSQLHTLLKERGLRTAVFMGGRLTEDLPDHPAADVSGQLEATGVAACLSSADMVRRLKPMLASLHKG